MTLERASRADLLASEKLETALLRIGLVCAGGYLLHLVSGIVSPPVIYRAPGIIVPLLLCGLLGFVLIAIAGIRPIASARWLILIAYLAGALFIAIKWTQSSPASDLVEVDTGLYVDSAAKLLLEGRNPYNWDFVGVSDLYRTPRRAATPLLNGAMGVSIFQYPALSFLLIAPFQVLDLPGAFLVSVLALLVLLTVLFIRAPKFIQPLILVPLVAGLDFAELAPIGTMDIVWALFLTCMVLVWDRPVWRAVFYGLAIAFKQNAWLVAPFLLIRLWLDHEDTMPSPSGRLGKFLAISGGIFLFANLPFILWDPSAWFRGMATIAVDPLVMLSHGGLASLPQLGIVALPKTLLEVLVFAVLGLLLFAYWRHFDVLQEAFWFMPGIVLWVSFRSLISYWLFWVFPATAAVLSLLGAPREQRTQVVHHSWKPTVALSVVALVGTVALGTVLISGESEVVIEPQYPFQSSYGFIDSMTVILTNNSDEEMVPRFSVQHQNRTMNPYPWHIDQGPATLGPGEAAPYRISVGNYKLGFLFHEDAQIVVTDAQGNYELRAVASLEPDLTYFYPEAINNLDYRVWDSVSGTPSFWQLLSDPPGSAQATPLYIDGRAGLDISLDSDTQGREWAALQNLILYQQKPFGIWLNLDPLIAEASDVAYGLEFDDGEHRLWLLFGARDYTGDTPDGVHIVHNRIPVGTWTYQEIDLPALYAGAGWESPSFRPAVFGQVDADFQLLWLRLMVATGTETIGRMSAHFGPIEQDYRLSPQTRMAQTLNDPGDFYLRLAQRHVRDRNYLRAIEAYLQALNFSPDNAEALEGIQQIRQLLSGGLER